MLKNFYEQRVGIREFREESYRDKEYKWRCCQPVLFILTHQAKVWTDRVGQTCVPGSVVGHYIDKFHLCGATHLGSHMW